MDQLSRSLSRVICTVKTLTRTGCCGRLGSIKGHSSALSRGAPMYLGHQQLLP